MKAPSNGQIIITWEDPKSAVAEAYRIVRTNLQFASPDERLITNLITSLGLGEGKSKITAYQSDVQEGRGQHGQQQIA